MKPTTILKGIGACIIYLGLFSVLVTSNQSCKSKDKKGSDKDTTRVIPDTTQSFVDMMDTTNLVFFMKQDTMSAKSDLPDSIYNLTLRAGTLDSIFRIKWGKGPAVALRFDFFQLRNNKRALHVCGVNDKDVRCTDYFSTEPTGNGLQKQGKLHREQQFVTVGMIRGFYGLSPSEPFPSGFAFTNIYFQANPDAYPEGPEKNLVFFDFNIRSGFKSSKGPIKVLEEGEGYTNPSPPFTPPCNGNCFDDTKRKKKE